MIQAGKINFSDVIENKIIGRTPFTSSKKLDQAFSIIAETKKSKIFVGAFQGLSAWEIHRKGDEFVQILSGSTELIILEKSKEKTILQMNEAMIALIPKGTWHKFNSEKGVTIMTSTPLPTEHFTGNLPSY